jgi:hypothetical protein
VLDKLTDEGRTCLQYAKALERGTNLAQNHARVDQLGMGLQAARRKLGAAILVCIGTKINLPP